MSNLHNTPNGGVQATSNFPVVFGGGVGTPLTMSSREIAELLEARHDNVKRTIERLSERGVIQLPPMEEVTNHLGQTVIEYRVGKRDSYVIVAQLSPEFTARLVDRWQQLEDEVDSFGNRYSRPALAVTKEQRLTMNYHIKLLRMAGITGNQALIAANRATTAATGIDSLGLLGISHMPAPQNEALLAPADIGRRIGGASAQAVNLVLTRLNLQSAFRDHKGRLQYEPTEAGLRAGGVMQDTGKNHGTGTPIRQLRWASSIVDVVEASMQEGRA